MLEDDAYSKLTTYFHLKRDNQIKSSNKILKIYYDLIEAREKFKNDKVTLRIEQLYPFPAKTLANILKDIPKQTLYGVKRNPRIWVPGILSGIILIEFRNDKFW